MIKESPDTILIEFNSIEDWKRVYKWQEVHKHNNIDNEALWKEESVHMNKKKEDGCFTYIYKFFFKKKVNFISFYDHKISIILILG